MKTIILNADNRSIILANHDEVFAIMEDHILKGNERIYGLGPDGICLYENVTAPADWQSGKYCFDGRDWTLNEDWIDATIAAGNAAIA